MHPSIVHIDRLGREYERKPGRPTKLTKAQEAEVVRRIRLGRENRMVRICEDYGIDHKTARNILARAGM